MWVGRVGAHAAPMFNDITTTRVLVADRQARYHHEASQHRLARVARFGRRARRGDTTVLPATRDGLGTVEPLPTPGSSEHRPAA